MITTIEFEQSIKAFFQKGEGLRGFRETVDRLTDEELIEKIFEFQEAKIRVYEKQIDDLQEEIDDFVPLREVSDFDLMDEVGNRGLSIVAPIGEGLTDNMKYDFFIENFDKFTLENLENLIK